MVTFPGVSTFLKQFATPEVAEHAKRFLGRFRGGQCYAHPFDSENHDEYFSSKETGISHLFLMAFRLEMGELQTRRMFVCFDGEPLDLIDTYQLLDRFLSYEQTYLGENPDVDLNEVNIDLKSLLLDGKWLFVGFLICHDHEGAMGMAIYDRKLTPPAGLAVLHANLRLYLLT